MADGVLAIAAYSGEQLADSLKSLRWDTASRIYGNNHASLIGLFAQWWIDCFPDQQHFVMESGPAHSLVGEQRKVCDALLCAGNDAIGVVEVEGTRYKHTARGLRGFLSPETCRFSRIQFGILALYSTNGLHERQGRYEEATKEAEAVSRDTPKPIIVVTLYKAWESPNDVRACSGYYHGQLMSVTVRICQRAQLGPELPLYNRR